MAVGSRLRKEVAKLTITTGLTHVVLPSVSLATVALQ